MTLITGFHAIEEKLKSFSILSKKNIFGCALYVSKTGPRVKKILNVAEKLKIPINSVSEEKINKMVTTLPEQAQNHRGIVLVFKANEKNEKKTFQDYFSILSDKPKALVLVLDSITDPHNIGAILRSSDQFGVDLVILPEHRSANDYSILSRTSAGASSWVPSVIVTNLVRSVSQLKQIGFWVFGADLSGEPISTVSFPDKTILIMGSEGKGIARLLKSSCDTIVSIPTEGKLDSLNVSVATGILLYEIRR